MREIALENVSFAYDKNSRSKPQCLHSISFRITQGSVLGIFGPSGAGKTTLIFLICGLLKPDEGRIWVDGEPLLEQKGGWKSFMDKIGVAFQFPEDMFFHGSISEEFCKALGKKGYTREDAVRLAYETIKWTGLDADSLWPRHPLHLSHGQLRQLSLALVWAQDWDLLILDEPTVGLDSKTQKRIINDIIHDLHEKDKIGIIASHDTSMLLPLVDYGLILNGGEIIIQGPRENILSKTECLVSAGLPIPPLADLALRLKKAGLPVHQIWQDLDQATHDILKLILVRESSGEVKYPDS